MWLWAWNQYDYVDGEDYTEVDAGNGTANYIGHNGDINSGKISQAQVNQCAQKANQLYEQLKPFM